MPTTATALEAARAAAARYTNAWTARHRAYESLPLDGPDRDAILGRLRDVARRAFREFFDRLDDLRAQGGEGEALALLLDVNERTTVARTPMEITVTEN